MKKKVIFIFLFFLLISIFFISKIFFNDKLIGRSLDFPLPPINYLIKNNYLISFYQWWGTMNGGDRNTFTPTVIPVNSILYFPLIFEAGVWFIGRYQIILTLFSAILFFYILSRRLYKNYKIEEKYKIFLSIISSFFFTFNSYFFHEFIFGSNAMYFTFALIPLLLYSAVSYLEYQKKIYFILSLLSLVIISSMLQHLIMAYIFLFLLALIYKNFKFFIKLSFLHFFLSFYWILPLLYSFIEVSIVEMVTANLSINLLESSQNFIEAFILKDYFFHRNLYNLALNNKFLSSLWIFNAFILLVISFLILFRNSFILKIHKKIILGFSIVFMLSLLFIKGGHAPFGNIIIYFYQNFSFFSLYRSLQHYIGFYVISISILFLFSSIYLLNKNKKFIYLLFFLVFINAIPWWYTLDLGSKNITSSNLMSSFFNQYYLTRGNEKMYALNQFLLDFAILHIPPGYSVNFLAVGKNEFNFITRSSRKIKSQGGDNGLFYGNKRFFATDGPKNNLSDILDKLEKYMYTDKNFFENYKNFFSLIGIRYFVIRNDIVPEFSKHRSIFNLENIKKAIGKSKIFSSLKTEDFVSIARIKNQYFLPHFYTPQTFIKTNAKKENLLEILSQPNYKIRSLIYFDEQNKDIYDEALNNKLKQYNLQNVIVLETKKDKIMELDEKIKKISSNINILIEKGSDRLSKKEAMQLKDLKMEKQHKEQEKRIFQSKTEQYFAKVKNAGNYVLSFQLLSCQKEKSSILDEKPLITINNKIYYIPYEIIKTGENKEKYKIKTDEDCFSNIKNIELNEGGLKLSSNYILGLDNLIFSSFFPQEITTPIIEFKRINPTKYRVIIHQAKNSFPLVFSESFHKQWKAYLVKPKIKELKSSILLDNYKVLENTEDDQATVNELKTFIKQGWVSNLGEEKINFISKNFKDTVQNDNLYKGHIGETWFKKSLSEDNHFMVNGYANAWWFDLDNIKRYNKYKENIDGSIDYEIIIEFWPQRLFYLGMFITLTTLIVSCGYLLYSYKYKK